MSKKLKPLGWLILISSLFWGVSCTPEKAEAIKIAAENFRKEAISAIQKVNHLFIQTVSMPSEPPDVELKKLTEELDREVLDEKTIGFLMEEKNIDQRAVERVSKEFQAIERGYYQFEEMFRSLPQGSFLARDAVKRAEKQAINLTSGLIHFAGYLQRKPVQFSAERTLILERAAYVNGVKDVDARRELRALVARDILKLRNEEETTKREAVRQCLKAAEAGRLVAKLIRNYEAMNVEDILVAVGSSLNFISEISGGQRDIASILEKYKSIDAGIREDPYWKELLSLEIPK